MKTKLNAILTLLLACIVQLTFAQEKTISGTVSDEAGLQLPGVNILIKGTTTGTQTDFDGKYTIKAKSGDILTFTYLGLKTQEVKVGASNTVNVTMAEDASVLDEVVVIGYGVQKRKEVTGAIASISGSDITGLVTPSFEGQLAGRATGVQITTSNGIIGEAPRIRIRGISSINSGTYPLVVVDGMPIYTGDTGGVASTNALGDINPNDIESYEILKDGAATAIYGSRGANGVILITTKKGKKGAMKVNYNSVIGYASASNLFDLLETPDFLVIANEKRANVLPTAQPAWAAGSSYNTDWQAAVLNNAALQMDHSLSLNGGTDKTKYYMSVGYTEQDGVAKANDMERYSIKFNMEHNINKWLSIGGGLAVTRTEYNGLNTGRNSLSGNIYNATKQLPNTPVYDPSHPTGYNLSTAYVNTVGVADNLEPIANFIPNIVYVLDHNKYVSKTNRTLANFFASADIVKGLNYRLQGSADNPITKGFQFLNPVHGDGFGANGILYNDNTDLLRWNIQNILNYNLSIQDSHNFALTAVTEYQKQRNEVFWGQGSDLLDEFYNQNLVTGSYATQESGGGVSERGIISYLGRLSYNYKQKYFLQGSLRRDGISQLSPENRWYTFTGYSAGWNIANEGFMESIKDIVSEFKLRGSYSQTGNSDIGNYPYLGLTLPSQYGSLNGLAFSQFGNDQLRWESSKKTDFGVDLGLLSNKIRVTFDYFNNDIDGLILAVPTAPTLGIPNNTINKNIGVLNNKGLEFAVDYSIFNNENFKWDVNANISFVKNKINSLPNGGADIIGGTSTDTNIAPNLIIREGESINSLYGYQYWGVNPANGNPVYYKADGSLVQGNVPTGTYFVFDPNNPTDLSTASSLVAAEDKVLLGNTLPTYYGGFSSKLSYKNFDFGFMFRFSGGNKIFNSTRRDLLTQDFSNNSTEILGRWQSPENPGDGVTPILYAGTNTFTNLTSAASTRFVEKGDFISLDNISLGYSFPKQITDLIHVDSFRFFVQAQNILMITDYRGLNPEMETAGVDLNGTPRSKVLSFGVNVNL